MLTHPDWFDGPIGLCIPGCGDDHHGKCSDWACVCGRLECVVYRAEWGEIEHEARGGVSWWIPWIPAIALVLLVYWMVR